MAVPRNYSESKTGVIQRTESDTPLSQTYTLLTHIDIKPDQTIVFLHGHAKQSSVEKRRKC